MHIGEEVQHVIMSMKGSILISLPGNIIQKYVPNNKAYHWRQFSASFSKIHYNIILTLLF